MTRWPLAVALLALLTASPATHAQTAQADLHVHDLAVVGPAPGWTEGTPQHTRFQVTVTNEGDAPMSYRIEYWWVQDGAATPLNGEAAHSFNVSMTPLPAKASHTHGEDWRLQQGQQGSGAVEARLVLADDAQGEPVTRPAPQHVARSVVHVYTRQISVTAAGQDIRVEPDGTGFFRVRVDNDGNGPETVALTQTAGIDDPRLSTLIDPPVMEVPAGSAGEATFYVSFHPAGDFSPFSGSYAVRADPGFGSRPEADSPTVTDAPGGEPAGYAAALEVVPGVDWSVPAGQQRTVDLLLTNTGERPDNYTFAPAGPVQWQASVAPARVALYPGEQAALRVKVTAPDDAVGEATFEVTARGSRIDAQTVELPFSAAGPSPAVEDVRLDAVPYVGDGARAVVVLANPGDAPTPDGTSLRLHVQAPGEAPRTLEALVGPVPPGSSRDVGFPLGTMQAGGTLGLDAEWSAPRLAEATRSFWVHAPDIDITPPQPLAGQPGETVAYRIAPHAFRITNTGNAAETVRVAADASHAAVAVEGDRQFTLEPGQNRTVPVLQALPAHAALGEDRLRLTVSTTGTGRDWIGEVDTTVVDRQPPVLRPDPLPVEWSVNETLALGLAVEDATPARANATVTLPDGGRRVVDLVRSGDRWTGSTTLSSPGVHTVSFAAADAGGNTAATPALTVTAATIPPPRVSIQASPGQNASADTRIGLQVNDTRPLHRLWVEVRQDDLVLRQNLTVTATSFRLPHDGLRPGPAEVLVVAQNAAGARGQATLEIQWTAPEELDGAVQGGQGDRRAPAPAPLLLAATLWWCRRLEVRS